MQKGGAVKKLAVGHAIQRASSRHHEVLERHLFVELIQKMKEYLLEAMLHAISEVHLALCDFCVGLPRIAEGAFHALGKMRRQEHRAIRFYLHSLIAAEGLEII